ncbi:MAG: hypothetical protein ACOVOW_18540 [Spirosomataceae bacterium]
MKLTYTFVCLLLFVFTTYCQDKIASKTVLPKDTMVTRLLNFERGKLIYKGTAYRKWKKKELEQILFYQPDTLLEKNYYNYVNKRDFSKIIAFVGGFGLGWSLAGPVILRKEIDQKLLVASIGVTGLAILLQAVAKSQLKQVINIYNDGILERKVSFSPLIYPSDYNRMNVGVALHF